MTTRCWSTSRTQSDPSSHRLVTVLCISVVLARAFELGIEFPFELRDAFRGRLADAIHKDHEGIEFQGLADALAVERQGKALITLMKSANIPPHRFVL